MERLFKNIAGKAWLVPAAIVALSLGACKKSFDVKPEQTLNNTQVYRDVFDADAAVIGLYGQFMGLAKQYVVLNELRADLMQVTDNADAALREINTHSVSENNPYADPRPFYKVINTCNDILKNFDVMLRENKFKVDEYNQRYSDVGALRSWLYLQLGIHYGRVPYVTSPIENIDALRNPANYPMLQFPQLLDSLISFTERLPFKNPYLPSASLVMTVDGYNTSRFFIEKNAFLGDLHLWKGNYTQAATYYRAVMEGTGYFIPGGGEDFFNSLRVRFAEVVTNNDLAVGYTRFRESDRNQLIENNNQGWRSMFARGQDAIWRWEWLWTLPFASNFSPTNPFIDLFSNRGGSYLVKPSTEAMDKWNSQMQTNGFPFDARGGFTYKMFGGQPVITKYLYNYLDGTTLMPINPLQKNGQWFLNRAASVHLRFAEAANRDGRHRLAHGMVNRGIQNVNPVPSGVTDVTNYQQTLYETAPYNFDARMGDFPRYRGDWHRSAGIRGRARLEAVAVVGDSTLAIENSIVEEGALELAYEGYRWPDLVRIALRRNDPAFLADKVYQKLLKDGNGQAAAVRTRLLNKDNWYLPFKF